MFYNSIKEKVVIFQVRFWTPVFPEHKELTPNPQ